MSGDAFHRFGDDYLTAAEWGKSTPDLVNRIVLALGTEPLDDARHLLAPVTLPSATVAKSSPVDEPDESTAFILDISGNHSASLLSVLELLDADTRAELAFPRFWGRSPGSTVSQSHWFPLPYSALDALPNAELPLAGIAISWSISQFALQGREAIRELEGYCRNVANRFTSLGWRISLRETPELAVARAARLNKIKARFARPVEMRLVPQGRPFPSRLVWRSAYALGLTWGEMDLFHWHEPISGKRLFTLSNLGQPGYFLPERAAEGEGIPGLSLGFELPTAPAPQETFDRMAVALDYLRHQLGGRPTASDGAELDAERLDTDRELLEEAVNEMTRSGISPGSPEAARYF
jgi:hypothetical protein